MIRPSLALLGLVVAIGAFAAPAPQGAFATGRCRNLFAEFLGRTDAEIDAKIGAAWQQLFYGRDDDQRVYYPVDGDMAYVADIQH